MAFGSTPKDSAGLPIGSVYVPNGSIVSLQGSTNTTTDASSNVSTPVNVNVVQNNSVAIQMADSDGDTASTVPEFAPGLYNGTTIDRQRGNYYTSQLLGGSGLTTSQTGTDQTNYNGRGVQVVFDMTSVGTGNVTLTIQGYNPVANKYYTLLAGAAVTTNTTNVYTVYPGNQVAVNASASTVVPRTWRVITTVGNSNPTTYTVSACVIV